MMLSYDRGDASRPRGHALLYFRSWSDPAAVFATYLIVPPISVEISKYIPPMFASQFQAMRGGGISVFPYPPIPEKVEEGVGFLERLARARDDDLISGGSVDTSSPERLLQASAEAAQQYFEAFSTYVNTISSEPEPPVAQVPESSVSVDVTELRYILMGEHERLEVLTKLIGQFLDAVGDRDAVQADAAETEIRTLGKSLPEKYKVAEIIEAARLSGPAAFRLTQLYLDRAFRLADEKYEAVATIDEQIRALKSGE